MTARFFYDCEFIEDGSTIELISIGIVDGHGEREYYAIRSDAPWGRIRRHPWLMSNVIPHLPGSFGRPGRGGFGELKWRVDRSNVRVKPKRVIANEIREFLLADGEPVELWADYGAYDHVVLAQLYGRMIDLPDGIPMWTNDVRQEAQRLGVTLTDPITPTAHDALADAHQTRAHWLYLDQARAVRDATAKATRYVRPDERLRSPLATGGVVTGPRLLVGESGPEVTTLPPGDTVRPDDPT